MAEIDKKIEDLKKLAGVWELARFEPRPVDKWWVLDYVNALTDANPLWKDPEYARKSRWGEVIAPPGFIDVFSPLSRALREKGNEFPFGVIKGASSDLVLPFDVLFAGGQEFEFYLPVRMGDTVRSGGMLEDVYEKRGGTGGRLVFVKFDIPYYNQCGELVAREKWVDIAAEASPSMEAPPAVAVAQRDVPRSVISPAQVHFDDVREGMSIPPLVKRITMTTIVMWAVATGDIGPPHFDYDYMKRVYGTSNVIAHGPISCHMLAQLVTNWTGPWGALKKHSTQFRGNIFPNEVIAFQGKVARKYTERGENFVELETWAENEQGRKVTLGKSLVTLPGKRAWTEA